MPAIGHPRGRMDAAPGAQPRDGGMRVAGLPGLFAGGSMHVFMVMLFVSMVMAGMFVVVGVQMIAHTHLFLGLTLHGKTIQTQRPRRVTKIHKGLRGNFYGRPGLCMASIRNMNAFCTVAICSGDN